MFFGPLNIENEGLHKLIAVLDPEMHLLVLRLAAILNIVIYDHSWVHMSKITSLSVPVLFKMIEMRYCTNL